MESSTERVRELNLGTVDMVPIKRRSVLLLLSCREFEENQDSSSDRQPMWEGGGTLQEGLTDG